VHGACILRLADGPDEVHWFVVGRKELATWEDEAASYDPKVEYYENLGDAAGGVFSGP
jgi:acyl-CoA dehydrogenase